MCGLAGIINPQRSIETSRAITAAMLAKIKHRGPDGSGIDACDNYVLGHCRLAIIDIEHGQQPMHSSDGRYTLVFNGEIYNYLELRQQLIQAGVSFTTFSDTEVLLQMLIQYGQEALKQLNGMFAFVFYDRKNKSSLLARDPFGIKPLYYIHQGDELLFASEVKALLAHPDVHPKVNSVALQHYLTFQFYLGCETLFDGISELEPGTCLVYNQHAGLQQQRYWDNDYTIDYSHTEDYFRERLLYLLEDSVSLQTRSDVPLGAHVSGGIDSSLVATMASNKLNTAIPLFHGRFAEAPQYDESEYARLIATNLQSKLFVETPSVDLFIDYLPQIIYMMDYPVAGPGVYPQFMVNKLAAEHVKVVLGGQGGDELFGGYARYLLGYLEQALKGAIFETQEEGQHLVTLSSIISSLPLLKQYQPLMQHFWSKDLFSPMEQRYFHLIDRSPKIHKYLSQDLLDSLDSEMIFAHFETLFNQPQTPSYINKMMHFDQKTLLPALLQVEDRVSMAVSLESRVPLLDTRIAELLNSVPPPIKFQGGKTKNILKQAVANLLPEQILNRKDKMGFPVPLHEWWQKKSFRDYIHDVLLSSSAKSRGIFNPQRLQQKLNHSQSFDRELWGMLCLELWHQVFIDR